jgi:hypothetical protein
MFCNFDLCEFYNILFGGIIIGIIASFIFIYLDNFLRKLRFIRKYKHLKSNRNKFDWISYSMSKEDSRVRNDKPNGAVANITLENIKIKIILMHENRKWIGEVQMLDFGFGILTLKYENENEYGKRDCIIGSYIENGETYDYIFLIPNTNKIFSIKKDGDRLIPEYDYGNEILIKQK